MSLRFQGRFTRVVSLLDSLKRGRSRRRQKLSVALPSALESLESRTLLSAVGMTPQAPEELSQIDAGSGSSLTGVVTDYGFPVYPQIRPAAGSGIEYINGEPVFEFGSDVDISWTFAFDSARYEVRIYHVDTGQEVVNENNLVSPFYRPDSLTAAGRYQVFVRTIDTEDQPSAWSPAQHFHLTAGQNETPLGSAQIVSIKEGLVSTDLNWTRAQGPFSHTYEVVIYNVAAGKEVFRQTDITGTSVSIDELLATGDEYQAFVRTQRREPSILPFVSFDATNSAATNSDTGISIYRPELTPIVEVLDWSAPFHFSGEGASLIPPAAEFDPLTNSINWEPIDGAASYDVVIYDTLTGREVINETGITETSFDELDGLAVFPFGLDTSESTLTGVTHDFKFNFPAPRKYQMFYRAHYDEASTGLWSSPLEFSYYSLVIHYDTPPLA